MLKFFSRAALAILICLVFPSHGKTAGENPRGSRLAIINLFEGDLSRAYTFSGPGQLPDFSALDQIYPSWDGGDPGGARRKWQQAGYVFNRVKFRVDSVFLTSDYTAAVRGEKSVRSVRKKPFLWWFHSSDEKNERTRFAAYVYRGAGGRWLIKNLTEL